MQSLGKIVLRAPAVGAKIWCLCFLPAGCHGNLTVLNLLSASVTKNPFFFAPGGQTMRWIEKWLTPFRIVTTFSLSMSPLGVATIFAQLRRKSLGEIELRTPDVGAKIGVFCMSRLVCLRVGDIVQTNIV